MADIFVSYAREDRSRAEKLVRLLEAQGWSVWWDRELTPGVSFSKMIERELAQVKCVVVLWSANSSDSDWVQAEATEGMHRNILVPASLDATPVPLVFRQLETTDLRRWPGHYDEYALEVFLATIAKLIEHDGPIKKPARPRRWYASAAMLAVLAAASGMLLLDNRPSWFAQREASSQPAASILVGSMRIGETDVSDEVAELLMRVPTLHIMRGGEAGVSPTTTLSLDALQTSNSLLVTVFEHGTSTTRLQFDIALDRHALQKVTRMIATRVAAEFGDGFLLAEADLVNDQVYRRYLRVRASLRLPQTAQKIEDVIGELESIANLAPRFAEAVAGLCLAHITRYRNQGNPEDFEAAERHCFRAARLDADNPMVSVALGRLYATGGQFAEAEKSLETALSTSPFLTEAMTGLADTLWRMERRDEAIGLFRRAQNLEPDDWRHYERLGGLLFQAGQYSEAVAEYKSALGMVTDRSALLSDLGSAYFMLNDFDGAVESWRASKEINPNFTALSNLGAALYFNGDFKGALESYREAIVHNPRDYRIQMNAAEAAYHAGLDYLSFYEATYDRASAQLAVNPDQAEVLSALAVSSAALGRADEAANFGERALLAGHDNVYVLYDLAVMHARMGSVEAMQKVLTELQSRGYSAELIARDANFNGTGRDP